MIHNGDCAGGRVEEFQVRGPAGRVAVTRCQECGGQDLTPIDVEEPLAYGGEEWQEAWTGDPERIVRHLTRAELLDPERNPRHPQADSWLRFLPARRPPRRPRGTHPELFPQHEPLPGERHHR